MDKVYIIGDVHGCYKTLIALVKQLPKDAKIIFVGDLIDRGKDSSKIIEFVRQNNHYCILGNHEYAMKKEGQSIVDDPTNLSYNTWLDKMYGGYETLESYKNYYKDEYIKYFKDDVDWLNTLPYYLKFEDLKDENERYLVVTHSAVNDLWKYCDFDEDSPEKREFCNTILFGRPYQLKESDGIFNVFGHTPVKQPFINEFCANIDTGCFYSSDKSEKYLTALEFPSKRVIQQVNIENS